MGETVSPGQNAETDCQYGGLIGYVFSMISRFKNIWGIGLILCTLTLPAGAQNAPLNTIEAVLASFVEANGGQENIDTVVSIRAKGVIKTEEGKSYEIVVLRKLPNLKRVITYLEEGVLDRGSDGETSWKLVALNDGRKMLKIMDGAEKSSFETDSHLLDVLFLKPGPEVEHRLTGVEYVGRVPCYVIDSMVYGSRRVSYLDSRTMRIPKVIEYSTNEEGEEISAVQELNDYVRVHGIWIARGIHRSKVGSETSAEVQFSEVKINDGIFNDIFAVPVVE